MSFFQFDCLNFKHLEPSQPCHCSCTKTSISCHRFHRGSWWICRGEMRIYYISFKARGIGLFCWINPLNLHFLQVHIILFFLTHTQWGLHGVVKCTNSSFLKSPQGVSPSILLPCCRKCQPKPVQRIRARVFSSLWTLIWWWRDSWWGFSSYKEPLSTNPEDIWLLAGWGSRTVNPLLLGLVTDCMEWRVC